MSEKSGSGKALIYCRVSTDEQVEKGYSLKTQEEQCRQYCGTHKMDVEEVFHDEGKSGRTLSRPAIQELLSRLKHGKIHSIVALKQDRIARNVMDYLWFKEHIAKKGVEFHLVDGIIADGALGNLSELMLAGFAQFESDMNSERTKLNMDKARREGRIIYTAPLGYLNSKDDFGKSCILPDEERAPQIDEAFRLMATGKLTAIEVLRYLNSKGFSTRRGKPVSRQTFYRILRNEVYIGMVSQKNGAPSVVGNFKPIVDRTLFEKVQILLEKNNMLSVTHIADREDFPLRRFVKCAKCGAPLTGSWCRGRHGTRYPYYKCWRRECDGLNIRKELLEAQFVSYLQKLTPRSELLDLMNTVVRERWNVRKTEMKTENKKKQLELDHNQDYIDKLTVKFIDGIVPDDVYKRQIADIKSKMNDIRFELEKTALNKFDINRILHTARKILETPDKSWQNATGQQCKNMQKALFPLGLMYSKEGGLETPSSTNVYSLLRLSQELNIELATPTGIEPVLPA